MRGFERATGRSHIATTSTQQVCQVLEVEKAALTDHAIDHVLLDEKLPRATRAQRDNCFSRSLAGHPS